MGNKFYGLVWDMDMQFVWVKLCIIVGWDYISDYICYDYDIWYIEFLCIYGDIIGCCICGGLGYIFQVVDNYIFKIRLDW